MRRIYRVIAESPSEGKEASCRAAELTGYQVAVKSKESVDETILVPKSKCESYSRKA
jgi:hypothetical protein